MCGIIGSVATNPVNQDIYDALTAIQHRGQDAAGMLTSNGGKVTLYKSAGLVREVMTAKQMLRLKGRMGLGHVRYPTAGSESALEAQPFYVNSPYGLAIVHNGNLINTDELKQDLLDADLRHLNTDSDSEVLLNIFAHELQKLAKPQLTPDAVFTAVKKVHERCVGAYSVIMLIAGQGMLAFRDPNGIRPLVFGTRKKDSKEEFMFASESVALDTLGYESHGDIAPGEAVFITLDGESHRQQCADKPTLNPCIFESVYLSRPDSIIDQISVHQFRIRLGKTLAKRILATYPDHDIDVVIPIPDTSRHAALPLALKLGVIYSEGFVKNRYIGRTFIMPGQQQREKSVRQKLNAIRDEFAGKNVLLVDDSIVRGTTSKEIIQLARDAGAKKVYFASAAPPVIYPNVYGIDMPSVKELIAHERTTEEVCKLIGADWLIYQDLDALYDAAQRFNPDIKRFEDAIFTGDYIVGDIDETYLSQLAEARNDKAKQRSRDRLAETLSGE